MDIRESFVNENLILILWGRFDVSARPKVLERFEKLAQDSWRRLLIDVQHVTFLDSAGLGVLAVVVKRVHGMKKEIRIVNPKGQVKSSLEEINFSLIIPVVNSDPEYTLFNDIP